jgi:hypothetical protein
MGEEWEMAMRYTCWVRGRVSQQRSSEVWRSKTVTSVR